MAKTSILIIEDDPEVADLERFHLEREGFAARIARSGHGALKLIAARTFDLILLDLMLPDLQGLDVCRLLKNAAETRDIPIVIVSAKADEADIVCGLELGADDYVTKPFSAKVLVARIKNILRGRSEVCAEVAAPPSAQSVGNGELLVDADRHMLRVHGKLVDVTRVELEIMQYLASRVGFVRTRNQILDAIHKNSETPTSRSIDVHMLSLRRKLGEMSGIIQTVRGIGYRLRNRVSLDEE